MCPSLSANSRSRADLAASHRLSRSPWISVVPTFSPSCSEPPQIRPRGVYLIIIIFHIHVYLGGNTHYISHVAVRRQPMGVGFLLPQFGVCGKHLYPLSHFYSLLMLTGFCARPLISFVFPRCGSCRPCSHTADTSWQGLSWLGRVGDAAGPWVLARREPEGFYYLAQIKTAPEASASGHKLSSG